MARVTVEDCILNVPNRFDLVLLAAQRAKQISSGNPLTVDRDNDKDAVVSLREIADKTISLDQLKEETTNSFSKRRSVEEKRVDEAKDEGEIQEAFADAAQGIEEPVVEGEAPGGLSFEGENVQAED